MSIPPAGTKIGTRLSDQQKFLQALIWILIVILFFIIDARLPRVHTYRGIMLMMVFVFCLSTSAYFSTHANGKTYFEIINLRGIRGDFRVQGKFTKIVEISVRILVLSCVVIFLVVIPILISICSMGDVQDINVIWIPAITAFIAILLITVLGQRIRKSLKITTLFRVDKEGKMFIQYPDCDDWIRLNIKDYGRVIGKMEWRKSSVRYLSVDFLEPRIEHVKPIRISISNVWSLDYDSRIRDNILDTFFRQRCTGVEYQIEVKSDKWVAMPRKGQN